MQNPLFVAFRAHHVQCFRDTRGYINVCIDHGPAAVGFDVIRLGEIPDHRIYVRLVPRDVIEEVFVPQVAPFNPRAVGALEVHLPGVPAFEGIPNNRPIVDSVGFRVKNLQVD
jgi:hypothetical protein